MKKQLWIILLILGLILAGVVLFFLLSSSGKGATLSLREQALAKSGIVYRSDRFVRPAEEGVPFGEKQSDGRWRVVLRSGNNIRALTDVVFDEVRCFSTFFIDRYSNLQHVGAVCMDGKWGYLRFDAASLSFTETSDLQWLTFPVYENAEPFCNGIAVVKFNGKYGCINLQGEWILEAEYDDARFYSESLLPVSINGDWYYITSRGVKVFGPFQGAESFSEGYAAVCRDGLWGYIDRKGNAVTEFLYLDAWEVSSGRAEVFRDGRWIEISLTE